MAEGLLVDLKAPGTRDRSLHLMTSHKLLRGKLWTPETSGPLLRACLLPSVPQKDNIYPSHACVPNCYISGTSHKARGAGDWCLKTSPI